MIASSVPVDRDAITLAWFADTVPAASKATAIRVIVPSQGQLSETTLVEFDSRDGSTATRVVKLSGVEPRSRRLAHLSGSYAAEVDFYQAVRNGLAVPSPRCDFAMVGDDMSHCLVLEKVQIDGCPDFGRVDALAVLTALAQVHSIDQSVAAKHDLGRSARNLFDDAARPSVLRAVSALANDERIGLSASARAFCQLCERHIPEPLAAPTQRLIHGDVRAGNIGMRDGHAVLFDWQTYGLGDPALDIAYFFGTSLKPADRRLLEDELLDHYLASANFESDATFRARCATYASAGLLLAAYAWKVGQRNDEAAALYRRLAERSIRFATDIADGHSAISKATG